MFVKKYLFFVLNLFKISKCSNYITIISFFFINYFYENINRKMRNIEFVTNTFFFENLFFRCLFLNLKFRIIIVIISKNKLQLTQ